MMGHKLMDYSDIKGPFQTALDKHGGINTLGQSIIVLQIETFLTCSWTAKISIPFAFYDQLP